MEQHAEPASTRTSPPSRRATLRRLSGCWTKAMVRHKDGTKLRISLVGGEDGTRVSIAEDMEMRGATADDVAEWLENRQWPKLLERLREKVGKG